MLCFCCCCDDCQNKLSQAVIMRLMYGARSSDGQNVLNILLNSKFGLIISLITFT